MKWEVFGNWDSYDRLAIGFENPLVEHDGISSVNSYIGITKNLADTGIFYFSKYIDALKVDELHIYSGENIEVYLEESDFDENGVASDFVVQSINLNTPNPDHLYPIFNFVTTNF